MCGWCEKAKQLATQYSLDYEYKNVDNDAYLNELKLALPNVKTIPQIWWHGRHIGGYEDFVRELEDTLGSNYGQERF